MGKLALQETLFNDSKAFYVYDTVVELSGSDTAYGWQCVATMEGEVTYLGDRPISIETAIQVYKDGFGVALTDEDVLNIMADNGHVEQ